MADHYRPSGRGPELITVFSCFAALTTLTLALRVYARHYIIKAFGIDDWVAIAGWVLFILHTGFAIAGAYHGTGQHVDLILPPENVPISLQHWWTCEPLYVTSNMFVKLSIGLMLLRLVVEPAHKWVILVSIGILEIYSIAYFFLFIYQCTPPSFFWTRARGDVSGTCMDTKVIIVATYVYSAITCIGDWTLALLPWVMIRKLQMTTRTKTLVAIVLALGSIASAATIVRIPYIASMSNTTDFLYATTDVAIWSCIETGLAIVASNAATLKPVVRRFLGRSSTGNSTRPEQYLPEIWTGDTRRSYAHAGGEVDTRSEHGSERAILKTLEVEVRPA